MVLKNITAMYLGVKPVIKIYLGGIEVYTVVSALIVYNMDTFNTTIDGTRTIDNSSSGGEALDCVMNSGNVTNLNEVDQSGDYPIIHTFGADAKQPATLGTDWVYNSNHNYTATLATSDLSNMSNAVTDNVQIEFTISNLTAGEVNGYGVDGTYIIEVTNDSLTAIGFSGDVEVHHVNEIKIPTESYVTYNDFNSGEVVTLDNTTLPISTTYNMTKPHQYYFTTDVLVTQANRDLMKSNPEAIFELYTGSLTTGLSFTLANVINLIDGRKGTQYLQDIMIPIGNEELTTDIHTGYTSLTGTVSMSGLWNSYPAHRLFDTNVSFLAMSINISPNTWYINYDYTSPVTFTTFRYAQEPANPARGPKNFIIEVSNNKIDWELVLTVVDAPLVTAWSEYYDISSGAEPNYRYIRMVCTENQGDKYFGSAEWEIMGKRIESIEIENYTTDVQLQNQNKGVQDLVILDDVNGRPESMADGYIKGADDARFITLPLETPQDYLVTKDIKLIEGGTAQVTITHTDDTTVVVP